MIHTTKLTYNRATYNNVYLFLKLYLNGPGTAEAEAILYADQEMKDQIGALRLPNYTFDELFNDEYDDDPMTKLHLLTITQLQSENPTATITLCDPIINVSNEQNNE